MQRLIVWFLGLEARLVWRVAGIGALTGAILLAWSCAREGGREAERTAIETETAETVRDLEEIYEQIDEGRAGDGSDALDGRLRDGTFLVPQPGSGGALPEDRDLHEAPAD